VVPEFDLPGHARGLLPLERDGLQFCDAQAPWRNQIRFDTPEPGMPLVPSASKSVGVLRKLLAEMSSLFPDPIFNIGTDETISSDKACNATATRALESTLVNDVHTTLNKTVMGWDAIQAAVGLTNIPTSDIAVESWTSAGGAESAAVKGFQAVDGFNPAWYLTHPAGWDADRKACGRGCSGPKGWAMAWRRPGGGKTPQATNGTVLGGEVSMWTDDYCDTLECGAWQNRFPPSKLANASCLYTRDTDDAFAKSIGGLTWPRGFVAAGAYWGFDYLPTGPASSDSATSGSATSGSATSGSAATGSAAPGSATSNSVKRPRAPSEGDLRSARARAEPQAAVGPHSAAFGAAIDAVTLRLQQRGSLACSPGAHCDYLSENGKRYAGVPPNQTNGCYGGDP
jgi:hypothetical protein